MNIVLLKVKAFLLDENISQAKKRYLFIIPFVLMGIFELIALRNASRSPELQGSVIPLTIITALFAGTITVVAPRIIGVCGIRNLYFSALVLAAMLSIYARVTGKDTGSVPQIILGFLTTALPYMLVMWLALLLSKKGKRPQHQPRPYAQ
jgi:hypothetical protein